MFDFSLGCKVDSHQNATFDVSVSKDGGHICTLLCSGSTFGLGALRRDLMRFFELAGLSIDEADAQVQVAERLAVSRLAKMGFAADLPKWTREIGVFRVVNEGDSA